MSPSPTIDHKYAKPDWDIVDYRYYRLQGTARDFRGPPPDADALASGRFISFLGAAQTFGRYALHPFPSLVAENLGIPGLNLGHGGAKPAYYLESPNVLAHVRRGQAAVLQVMSARATGNPKMDPVSSGNSFLRLRWRPEMEPQFADMAWRLAVQDLGLDETRMLARQSQERWVEEMRRLLQVIEVPTLLLWFARRDPDRESGASVAQGFVGTYPHLIERWMVEATRTDASDYLEVVTQLGMFTVTSRFDGRILDVDASVLAYYPSASEHAEVALRVCERLRHIPGD